MKRGGSWKDSAVLYRTNAQSRILEEKFVTHNIPYRMVGGVNFYQRKEIKDILAYLKTIANGGTAWQSRGSSMYRSGGSAPYPSER